MEAKCTFSRFKQAVAKYPQRPAVYFLGDCFTYRQLQGIVKRFPGGLASQGIKKGDRVVLYLSNSPQFVVAFLAVQKLGAATMISLSIYTSHEIEYMVKDAGAKTIVYL